VRERERMRKMETQKGYNMDPGKKKKGCRRQESWKRGWMRFKCKSFTSSKNNHNTNAYMRDTTNT